MVLNSSHTQRQNHLTIAASRIFLDSGLHGIDAEVSLALDVSSAMAPLFADGSIGDLVGSLTALATRFDDDGTVPAWVFDEAATKVASLRSDDIFGWVTREALRPAESMTGHCRYAPIINAISKRYFPREWAMPAREAVEGGRLRRKVMKYPSLIDQRPFPIFVIVVTGGDCVDPADAAKAVRRASHLPIFFQFAGISPPGRPRPDFAFLRKLDRLSNRYTDNCGFFEPKNYHDPAALFSGLLNEFPDYLRLAKIKEMLLPKAAPSSASETARKQPSGPAASVGLDHSLELEAEELARQVTQREARQQRRRARARGETVIPPDPTYAQGIDQGSLMTGAVISSQPNLAEPAAAPVIAPATPVIVASTLPPMTQTPALPPVVAFTPAPAVSPAKAKLTKSQPSVRIEQALEDAATRLARIRARRAARRVHLVGTNNNDDTI